MSRNNLSSERCLHEELDLENTRKDILKLKGTNLMYKEKSIGFLARLPPLRARGSAIACLPASTNVGCPDGLFYLIRLWMGCACINICRPRGVLPLGLVKRIQNPD